jgi:hypothetical protein
VLLKFVKQLSLHDVVVLEVFNRNLQLEQLSLLTVSHQVLVRNSEHFNIALSPRAIEHFLLVEEVDLVHDTAWLFKRVQHQLTVCNLQVDLHLATCQDEDFVWDVPCLKNFLVFVVKFCVHDDCQLICYFVGQVLDVHDVSYLLLHPFFIFVLI